MSSKTTTQIVAAEGWILLGVGAVAAVLFLVLGWYRAALLVSLFVAAAAFFFRNPERIPQEQDALAVIAPIDGRVEEIALREEGVAVRIFNSPLDVHLLRMPLQGQVVKRDRSVGLPAVFASALDRLSYRESYFLETATGLKGIGIELSPEVTAPVFYTKSKRFYLGERMGFFHGGRVTVVLPRSVELRLAIGDRTVAGESVLGFIRTNI